MHEMQNSERTRPDWIGLAGPLPDRRQALERTVRQFLDDLLP